MEGRWEERRERKDREGEEGRGGGEIVRKTAHRVSEGSSFRKDYVHCQL